VPGVRVRWPAKRRSIRLALIFWFFCIKAKEQIKNVPRSASLEKCKQMQSVAAHIAFFTGQRSDHVFKEAREKKAKFLKTL